jgi:hypothetical protein
MLMNNMREAICIVNCAMHQQCRLLELLQDPSVLAKEPDTIVGGAGAQCVEDVPALSMAVVSAMAATSETMSSLFQGLTERNSFFSYVMRGARGMMLAGVARGKWLSNQGMWIMVFQKSA